MNIPANKRLTSQLASAIILASFSAPALAATLYVEKWGDDSNPCTRAAPCESIQHAIDSGGMNARVIVGPGIYPEVLHIVEDGIRLESTAGRYSTSIGSDSFLGGSAGDPMIQVDGSRVNIGGVRRGFEVVIPNDMIGIRVGQPGGAHAPISHVNIIANQLQGNNQLGTDLDGAISLNNVDLSRVLNNELNGIPRGIVCDGCRRSVISGNSIMATGGSSEISGSSSKYNFNYGIVLGDSEVVTVTRNLISVATIERYGGRIDSVGIDGVGIYAGNTSNSRLLDNVVKNTLQSGISVAASQRLTVARNLLHNTAGGISVSNSENMTVLANLSGDSTNTTNGDIYLNTSSDIRLRANRSASPAGPGMNVDGSYVTQFVNNGVHNAECGVKASGSSDSINHVVQFFAANDADSCGDGAVSGSTRTLPPPFSATIAAGL